MSMCWPFQFRNSPGPSCKGSRLHLWGACLPFSGSFWAYLRTQLMPSSFESFFFPSSLKTWYWAQSVCQVKETKLKRLHAVWSHVYDILEKVNYRFGKQMPGVGKRWGTDHKGPWEKILRYRLFYNLIMMMFTRLYVFVQIHRTIH